MSPRRPSVPSTISNKLISYFNENNDFTYYARNCIQQCAAFITMKGQSRKQGHRMECWTSGSLTCSYMADKKGLHNSAHFKKLYIGLYSKEKHLTPTVLQYKSETCRSRHGGGSNPDERPMATV